MLQKIKNVFLTRYYCFVPVGPHISGMPGYKDGPKPIMKMYGVTNEGNSVLCHVHGFVPYLFVQAPSNFASQDCAVFQSHLNQAVLADMRSNRDNVSQVGYLMF